MPTRDNPHFTAPVGEDIDAEFSTFYAWRRAQALLLRNQDMAAIKGAGRAAKEAVEEARAEVMAEAHPAVNQLFATETTITFMGDELGVPAMTSFTGTPTEQANLYFDLLSDCDCCERHQTARPESIHGWKDMPDRKHLRPEACLDPSRCQCTCRHRMRNIARKF